MVPASILIVAIMCAVLGQRVLGQTPTGWLGWALAAASVILAVLAFVLQREPPEDQDEKISSLRQTRNAIAVVPGIMALAGCSFATYALWHKGYSAKLFWLWAASLVVAVLAAWWWEGFSVRGRLRSGGPVTWLRSPGDKNGIRVWVELLLVAGILGLGVFMRLYRLQSMPPGIFVDETNAALDALQILEGRPDSPFGTGWFETPTMYAYYLLGLFKTIGINYAALKTASLLPAILTVLAIYPLARHLFGVPTALASTFLLSVNRWHVNMSRWGWNEVAPPLFQIGAAYFLIRGAKRKHLGDFALGGLLLGLGMYTYLASRLAVVGLAAYVLYRIAVDRGFLKKAWSGLAVFSIVYLMTFAPLASTYLRDPFTFWNRSKQVSVLKEVDRVGSYQPVWDNVKAHAKMFHVSGDRNPRHNLPSEPMLDPVTGALFLVGLGYSLWRWKDHRRGLSVLWLLCGLLGGILTQTNEAPQAYRTLLVVPAITLIAGDALAQAVRVLATPLGSNQLRVVPGAVAGCLLLWSGWMNYDLFFNEQASDVRVWQAFSPVETAVAREVSAKQHDHSLYLSHRLYYFSPLRFFTYEPLDEGGGGLRNRPYHLASPWDDLPIADLSGDDALMLLDVYYQDLLGLFTAYYPGTTAEMVRAPHGQPLYLSVTVPGDEIVALQGLEASYIYQEGASQSSVDPVVSFEWSADFPSEYVPDRIDWNGSLRIPASGSYTFRLEGGLEATVDGTPIGPVPVFLGKGLHSLDITQDSPLAPGRDVARLLWTPPGEPEQIVPASALFRIKPPNRGLVGRFYQGEGWQGDPVFEQVSPLVLFAWPELEPWVGPFSATWTGRLLAPSDGSYLFRLHADDGARLWLDGTLLGESLKPDTVNMVEANIVLGSGPHDLRVDFFQRGGGKALEFWWTPPNGRHQVVPPEALQPG